MPFTDLLISLREKFLDLVSGADRARTLNPSSDPSFHSRPRIRTGNAAAPKADPSDGNPASELVDLLHEVISRGLTDHGERVDYAALRTDPLYDDFRHCTAKLRAFDPFRLSDRNARLAFWINLYNTLVLDGVIALGVRRSVMERRAGMGFFRRAAYDVDGRRVSCDDIEHGVLRVNRGHPLYPGKQFGRTDPRLIWVIEPFEARIHFALNCASRSCPPIRAYLPAELDAQLDLAARSYLAAEVEIAPAENTLRLPSIFKWFGMDFGGRDGIVEFVLDHLVDTPERAWLIQQRGEVILRYKPYDWRLNGRV